MLAIGVLLTASLLPASGVFIVALIHCIFIIVSFAIQPHNAEMQKLTATLGYGVLVRPILLQLLVDFVSFLWSRSMLQASQRATSAEEIARLEHNLHQQAQVAAEEKRQLETSIELVVDVHQRVANGDFAARVPLNQSNVLWQVAGSLNNLVARLQRAHQAEKLQQRTEKSIGLFLEARNRAQGGLIHDWTPTQTSVDALVRQHNSQAQQIHAQLPRPHHNGLSRPVILQSFPASSNPAQNSVPFTHQQSGEVLKAERERKQSER